MKPSNKHYNGFTLLELSIVLVVIGLILGGVVAGRSLVESSELKSIISGINDLKTSIESFRLKYNATPGDMRNAKSYWPDPDCQDSGSNTCNGNGNGRVETTGWEHYRAWNHMSLGGFLRESYTGIQDSGKATLGVNMPTSSILNGGFQLGSTTIYGRSQGNYIQFSSEENNDMDGPIISGRRATTLDDKIDDGLADNGQVFAARGYTGGTWLSSGCVSSANFSAPSNYSKSDKDITCRMFFWFN